MAVSYDANGNTITYDADGAGPIQSRSFAYDGENRPITITQNGNATRFAYGPDGERIEKSFGANRFVYLGADSEYAFTPATPAGELTSTLHPDVARVGAATDYLIKDHLASNRLTLRHAPASTKIHNYGPYGQPLTSDASQIINGKSYINQRYDAETNLQYLHARYLDPNLGRFLTPDTWEFR